MNRFHTDENDLLNWFKLLPPHSQRRVLRKFRHMPDTPVALWIDTSPRNESRFNVRVDWLTLAGWDAGGWADMEWGRLPTKLQEDLKRVFPTLQATIKRESNALLAAIGEKPLD